MKKPAQHLIAEVPRRQPGSTQSGMKSLREKILPLHLLSRFVPGWLRRRHCR